MTPRLSRTALAENDLIEIWTYVARDSPAAADRVLDRLDDRSTLIAQVPGVGARRDDLGPGLRCLTVGSYLVVYRQIGDEVEIVRYLHGRRDVRQLLNRSV